MIPDTLAVGTAITHRLTHPADESPFGAPSVKGNLSCNAAHFYVLPALSRSAHSHGGPSASTNPEFRSEPGRRYPSQFVAEEWRWPAESGHRWGQKEGTVVSRHLWRDAACSSLTRCMNAIRRSVSPWMLLDIPQRRQVEVDSSAVICWSVSSWQSTQNCSR